LNYSNVALFYSENIISPNEKLNEMLFAGVFSNIARTKRTGQM